LSDRLHRDSRKKIEDLSCVLVSCQKTIQQQQHTSEADRKTIENLREEVLMLSRRVHEVELERDRAQADFKASLNLIEDLTTSLTEVRQRIWIPLFLLFGQFLDSY
jgi:hypothetical protein